MAPHSESYYKTQMIRSVKDQNAYATRVEDKFRVGLLDMIFVIGGHSIFAEAKMVSGRRFMPSLRQGIEMVRIQNAGGIAILLGIAEMSGDYTAVYATQLTEGGVISDSFGGPMKISRDFPQFLLKYVKEHYVRQPRSS